jgi:hypothetical protein
MLPKFMNPPLSGFFYGYLPVHIEMSDFQSDELSASRTGGFML